MPIVEFTADGITPEYWLNKALVGARTSRHEAGLYLACQLRDGQYRQDISETTMRQYARTVTAWKSEPYTEDEAMETLKSVLATTPREPVAPADNSAPTQKRDYRAEKLKQIFPTAPPQHKEPTINLESVERFEKQWSGVIPLAGSPAAAYLESRGIPEALAIEAGVLYHPRWYFKNEKGGEPGDTRPAAVFPFHDLNGNLIAGHGRRIDPPDVRPDLKSKISYGPRGEGMFWTPGARSIQGPVILVEGPIDALTIALAGYPAIGRGATDYPTWFGKWAGLRSVYIGWDDDSTGNAKVQKVMDACTRHGARCYRLKPEGAKDANDMLIQYGVDYVRGWLEAAGITEPTIYPSSQTTCQETHPEHPCKVCGRSCFLVPVPNTNKYDYHCTCGNTARILDPRLKQSKRSQLTAQNSAQ